MSLPTLSFPTQPSPSQPNPPLKPCRRYGLRATVGGLVTNSSLGGKRDEPTASGHTGPGCDLHSIPGRAGVPKTRFRSDALKMDEVSTDCILETTKPYLTTLLVKVRSDDKEARIYWQP